MAEIQAFGPDVEVAPKNAYVSLKRKKQFVTLQPATETRFKIGVNLKGQEPEGKPEAITSAGAMCSHKMNLTGEGELDKEVVEWLRKAYKKTR